MTRQRYLHRPTASLPSTFLSSPLRQPSFSALSFMDDEPESELDRSSPSSASSDSEDSDYEPSEEHRAPYEEDNEEDEGITWGHPLQRMVTLRRPSLTTSEAAFGLSTYSSSTFPTPEHASQVQEAGQVHYLTFEDEYNSSDEDEGHSGLNSLAQSDYDSDSESDSSSVDWDDVNFEELIDDLLSQPDFNLPDDPSVVSPYKWSSTEIVPPPSFASLTGRELQVLPLLSSSPTLYLILHFNQRDLRFDPWNPVPRVVGVAERTVGEQEYVFLLLPQLDKFDEPPLVTLANWVDFLRQGLEALVFMHEHDIVRVLPTSASGEVTTPFTVDTGYLSSSPDLSFDRTRYPVKYYLELYAISAVLPPTSVSSLLPNPRVSEGENTIDLKAEKIEDVKKWGEMIHRIIQDVEPLSKKLAPLVSSMVSGEFSAENSRKLFEGLCWGLGEQ